MKEKISLFLLLINLFLCSCQEYEKSFKIVDLHVQRIEIEGNQDRDSCLYMFYADCEYRTSYRLYRPQCITLYTENGCEDSIKGFVIEDSLHNSIKNANVMNCFNGREFYKIYLFQDKESDDETIISINSYNDWNDIVELFKIGGPNIRVYQAQIFSIPKGDSPPSYFRLIFSDHELKVKINNDPVVYKVEDVVP